MGEIADDLFNAMLTQDVEEHLLMSTSDFQTLQRNLTREFVSMAKVRKQTTTRKRTKKKVSTSGFLSEAKDISFDDEGLKMLVYGQSKTGKTTFWSSFPKPILALLCSGSKNQSGELRSIKNMKKGEVKCLNIDSCGDIIDICSEIEDSEYKTVILDHATFLQDKRLAEIVGLEQAPNQKDWGIASQQDYGQLSSNMKDYFRALLNLKQNVVIIAQERINAELDTDLIAPNVGAALTPSIAGWLYPAVDYILQTFKKGKTEKKEVKIAGKKKIREKKVPGVDYCLRTGPDEVYVTGFRLPKGETLPDHIVDPTYAKIMELLS